MVKMRSDPPNVVVFFTDQQRWDTTRVHGNPLCLTPNFERMVRYGTHLSRSFTNQPVCGPARSSLQTGLYPTVTGCYRNEIPLPSSAKTLAHHFREAGYDTAYIGKWHLADEEPVPEFKRGGYGYWLASNILEFTSDAYSTTVYNNDNQPVKLPGYRVDALADAAVRYIDAHRERPFYLFVSFLEPHHQNSIDGYPAPDGYRERYVGRWVPPDLAALGGSAHQHLAGYYGMVKRLDEALGRLFDALKSLHLMADTIVLFTSDHGCHFKTRNAEYKRSLHEASIRVPTALSGPGFNGGGEVRRLISLLDLSPTLLDAAGLKIPQEMQGHSILPLVRGEQSEWSEEVFVQISESEVGRAVRTQRWKYGVVAPDRDGWQDAASDRYVEAHLYDLLADPYELENLVGFDAYREVSSVLRNRLLRCMVEAGEKEPEITLAPERASGERHVSPEDVSA
jgi:arylsulfatase A-like enzyme